MEFTFLDPYLNPSAERKTIKRYATVRSGVGIDMIRKRSASTDLLPVLPVRGGYWGFIKTVRVYL